MARFLILVKPEKDKSVCVCMPDDHVFGTMEDYERHVAHFGNDKGWPGDFVIVDCPEISVAEGRLYSDPIINEVFVDDPDIPGNKLDNSVIAHEHAGEVDYKPLERRSPESGRDTLNTIKKITRDETAVRAALSVKI